MTQAPQRQAGGFTLLEVIVAVVIAALCLSALAQVFATGVRAAGAASDYTRAVTLAQSLLASAGVEKPLEEGAESGTIFKSRKAVGRWTPGMDTTSDFVLTRILWLHGLEPRNANTFQRYIYIHGTNDEKGIGRPGSHGCVRLKNRDVIELFDLVPVGTPVWIGE